LYAIDPLAEFYKKKFQLNYSQLTFIQGRAEKLPFKDNFFDIVILANVLDHTENPEKALSEIKRVLKNGGMFYFENLFYQKKFIHLANIYGTIKKFLTGNIFNIHHPFMFQFPDMKSLLSNNFLIAYESIGRDIGSFKDINEMKEKKKKERKLTAKIPALFGLYGPINYTAICRK
jgi:ubiquinone/menaquinone biosynthesis C-methylase UbiE